MSEVNLDFIVSNNNINFTVAPNDITFTPTDIQLSFFSGGLGVPGGTSGQLQYNNGHSTRDIFFKMHEDIQVSLVLKIMELIPNTSNLDEILKSLSPNTKLYNVIAKYQVFK